MSDREQVVQWKREDLNDKESTLLLQSVLIDEVPITDAYVRA